MCKAENDQAHLGGTGAPAARHHFGLGVENFDSPPAATPGKNGRLHRSRDGRTTAVLMLLC